MGVFVFVETVKVTLIFRNTECDAFAMHCERLFSDYDDDDDDSDLCLTFKGLTIFTLELCKTRIDFH